MDKRIAGVALGTAGMLFWFMPFVYIDFRGTTGYQSGEHIGGIAYLLLFASLVYAVLSWFSQHSPRVIASGLALAICLLFLMQAGSSAGWGLYGLVIVSSAGLVLALKDSKAFKTAAKESAIRQQP